MKRPAELYDSATIDKLLGACGGGYLGTRNRALLAVLYHAGLRCAEALALQTHDIVRDDNGIAIHVRSGKGSKQRVVGLRAAGVAALDAWLAERENVRPPRDPGSSLFFAPSGDKLNTAAVRMLLPRLAKRAGITQRMHAHGFRHTHAFELMSSGIPVPFIQRQLGHSSMVITEKYLNHCTPEALLSAIQGA